MSRGWRQRVGALSESVLTFSKRCFPDFTIFIISCDHSFLISPPFEVVEEMQVEAVGAPGKNESYSVEKHPDSFKRAPGLRLLFNCAQARPNS